MHFDIARPDAVRAINQRWLLKFWMRHRGLNGGAPKWQDVKPDELRRVADSVSFLDVTGEPQRFFIRAYGPGVTKLYGEDARGRYLNDIVPRDRHDSGLMPYRHSCTTGLPVYTTLDVPDDKGRIIHFERLILPFCGETGAVERILSAFEFVCVDGAFDDGALNKLRNGALKLKLCATIDIGAAGA